MRVSALPFVVRLGFAFFTLTCCASPAFAAWSANPVPVTSTLAAIPLVEGCADGAYGAFVAWQEGSPTGVVRAQHLLSNGDLDPAWPAEGAVACNIVAVRTELVALPDRIGGAYLFWKEGNSLFVTRLAPDGAVASGWPERGRSLGGVHADSPRPNIIEDGSNGFYAVWTSSLGSLAAARLGPGNTGTGGWPNGVRSIVAANYPYETMYWPAVALAPDGGIFVAWASSNTDDPSLNAWRLRRLAPSGANASGWSDEGLSLGGFQRALLGATARGSLQALAPDGRGGVFLLIGDPYGTHPYYPDAAYIVARLHRLQGDGQPAADWPAEGMAVPSASDYYLDWEAGSNPDYGYGVAPDGRDGAFVGVPNEMIHYGVVYGIANCGGATGCDGSWRIAGLLKGHEVGARGDGGLFLADFYPHGPFGPYEPGAFIGVDQTPPAGKYKWSESHPECCSTWYTDIGLAPTGDGGTILLWSQVRDRVGLFARRFNPAGGEVTAVEPSPGTEFGIYHLRYEQGVGVRAAVLLSGSGPARFELYDVAGRRIASQPIELFAMAARAIPDDLTLAGTADLRSGLYFGRVVQGGRSVAAKVMVAR